MAVACLDQEKRQGSSVSQLANFKMDMLYGSRHRRVTSELCVCVCVCICMYVCVCSCK